MEEKISKLIQLLSKPASVVLVAHVNPDGDAIGACLGLYHYLIAKGHTAQVITPNAYPNFLHWLPASKNVIAHTENKEAAEKAVAEANIIILLDFNGLSRTAGLEESISKSKATKVLIDHHVQPENIADIIFSDITVSSTCELTCRVIRDMGEFELVNASAAQCFYTGIMTDTGSFSYSVNAETHRVASHLLKQKIDPVRIHQLIYDTYSESRTRLLGFCLSEKLVVISETGAAYIWLTKADLERFNHQDGDTEGIVNFPLSIAGINMSAIFVEKEDRIKISLRSKGTFNVNLLSRKYFNGGGHKNAAGGHLFTTMEEALSLFERIAIEEKEEIKAAV